MCFSQKLTSRATLIKTRSFVIHSIITLSTVDNPEAHIFGFFVRNNSLDIDLGLQ